jgi:hypothetical protein
MAAVHVHHAIAKSGDGGDVEDPMKEPAEEGQNPFWLIQRIIKKIAMRSEWNWLMTPLSRSPLSRSASGAARGLPRRGATRCGI